jgi:hypothetical protein
VANSSGKGDDPEVRPNDGQRLTDGSEIPEPASEPPASEGADVVLEEEGKPGPFGRLAKYLSRPAEQSREAKSGERTRGLVVLAGTAIACVFLFFGLFTTDSRTSRKEPKPTPSLGRPQTVAEPDAANRSPIPQHSVNQQSNEESGELTEGDVLGTMRNRGTQPPAESEPEPPTPPRRPIPSHGLNTVNFDDPALTEAYRRQGLRPPAGRVEVNDWTRNEPPKQLPAPVPAAAGNGNDSLRKSSIVFVRSGATSGLPNAAVPVVERASTPLLPQGTALVARLQHAVSSAAKVPVTAVIEYNYEEDGQLIVPAGTKAYGELSQATPQGWVSLKFHTLEFPNGDQERINGSAISMERTALRGDVNGKNGARKFLTRTLTGVGTIAAFAVGGRGLTGGIDNSVLLRERLASNIALAGEQELAMLAYQQNIVVTVPANTRFYLVLHEAGVSRPADTLIQPSVQSPATAALRQTSARSALSEQELREMMHLRNELREMNRLMQLSSPRLDSPVPENR